MKKRKASKIVSLFMGATMAISFWGTNVMAEDGTEITSATTELAVNTTYYIADVTGLKRLSALTNTGQVAANSSAPTAPIIGNISQTRGGGAYIYLTTDIDLGDVSATDSGFDPMGQYEVIPEYQFASTFDGQGHMVILTLNRSTSDYVGLFGYVGANGLVCNVGVGGSIKGKDYTGGVVGSNYGSVSNCYNTGSVVTGGGCIGGVVGYNDGPVSNCYNTGAVTGSDDYAGGVVGYFYGGQVNNCYYLTGTGIGDGTTSKSEAEMKSQDFVAVLNDVTSSFAQDSANLNKGFPVLKGLGYVRFGGRAKVGIGGSSSSGYVKFFVDAEGVVSIDPIKFNAKPGYKLDHIHKNGVRVNLNSEGWQVTKTGAAYSGNDSLRDYTVIFERDE